MKKKKKKETVLSHVSSIGLPSSSEAMRALLTHGNTCPASRSAVTTSCACPRSAPSSTTLTAERSQAVAAVAG